MPILNNKILAGAFMTAILVAGCSSSNDNENWKDSYPDPYKTDVFERIEGETKTDACVFAKIRHITAENLYENNNKDTMVITSQPLQSIKDACNKLYGPLTEHSTSQLSEVIFEPGINKDTGEITGSSTTYNYFDDAAFFQKNKPQ